MSSFFHAFTIPGVRKIIIVVGITQKQILCVLRLFCNKTVTLYEAPTNPKKCFSRTSTAKMY